MLGAVVLTYNLPSLGASKLKLDAPVITDIFLGKITKWNDARIAALNPGVKLPATDLLVVHRSDGSGTTFVFVDYLSKVSDEWRTKVGKGNSVNWPTGLGGKDPRHTFYMNPLQGGEASLSRARRARRPRTSWSSRQQGIVRRRIGHVRTAASTLWRCDGKT